MSKFDVKYPEHGKVYTIQTSNGLKFTGMVEGPVQDGRDEFYIVSTPDGDFDIELGKDGRWDAGGTIGKVLLKEVN